MNQNKQYCLALDLKDDQELISKYKAYHASGNAWPEITDSIKSAGILDMQIYCTGNRLFMIMEVDQTFDPDLKAEMDAGNPKVQEWESLMDQFQVPLPWADEGQKWVPMDKIFQLV
ncbi:MULTISPECIES: L-rhamnose mutarotase [Reichenbachiella]|uniref:L-rhamnose mutarotase n=1 Tax=Reichenbachiella agariperforans TaxID=156994 RepID=A0A1M6UJI4_REIAG|nr:MULTISPECIES: L-rhamnose mutarotase [Reichenbachiella]MBU2912660.1 L-rhamnose mutarotase [Reichenbachiella agariperforans]RJE73164.1 L-fucose mutarotase [Reichenbachiella sp. MSK19-1]SHK69300.1 L-rhamnose mutarotase [Reichenbachiella agariperforans]